MTRFCLQNYLHARKERLLKVTCISLITSHWQVIGSYVGLATVGIFILWYTRASFLGINLVSDWHTLVELSQLRNWGECPGWSNFVAAPFTVAGGRVITFSNPCDYFSVGKVKAMTLSLSVALLQILVGAGHRYDVVIVNFAETLVLDEVLQYRL